MGKETAKRGKEQLRGMTIIYNETVMSSHFITWEGELRGWGEAGQIGVRGVGPRGCAQSLRGRIRGRGRK